MLRSSVLRTGPAEGRVVAPTVPVPLPLARNVVHASLIQSDRDTLFFAHELSTDSVRLSSMVTENRTIQIHLVVHFIRVTIGLCTIRVGSGSLVGNRLGNKGSVVYFSR